jgi:hypothetical protein
MGTAVGLVQACGGSLCWVLVDSFAAELAFSSQTMEAERARSPVLNQ